MGVEKKRGSDFDVTVSANIGVSSTVDGFDLIQALLGAVSSNIVPNKDEFQKAGLTADQIATIATAINTGIERSLQLSLAGQIGFVGLYISCFQL